MKEARDKEGVNYIDDESIRFMNPFTRFIVDHRTQIAIACRNTPFSKGLNMIKINAERVPLMHSPYL